MLHGIGLPFNDRACAHVFNTPLSSIFNSSLNVGMGVLFLQRYARNPLPNATIAHVYSLPLAVFGPQKAQLGINSYKGIVPWSMITSYIGSQYGGTNT
jgi:hypothetical protein